MGTFFKFFELNLLLYYFFYYFVESKVCLFLKFEFFFQLIIKEMEGRGEGTGEGRVGEMC